MGDRRNRQQADKRRKQAVQDLEKVTKEGDGNIKEAERNETRAGKHLDRMRAGYSDGVKLYYDIYKTLATLTTGSILVIVALSRGLLPDNVAYAPLLWLAYFGLLVSMLAALISMELITSGVFVTLTKEADDIERFAEYTNNRLKWRTRIAGWAFALGVYLFVVFVALPPLAALIGAWVWAPFGIVPVGVYVALRKWL